MTFQERIDEAGITVTTTYLPYDPSEIPVHKGSYVSTKIHSDVMNLPMKWHFKVLVGSQEYTGTYSQGSGHCKYPKRIGTDDIPDQWPYFGKGPVSHIRWLMMQFYAARLMGEFKDPCDLQYSLHIGRGLKKYPQPDPTPAAIIHSVLIDSGCASGRTPGEFMTEFGYDDFDKGFEAYQACQNAETFWIRTMGLQGYGDLLDAAWDDPDLN